MERQRAALLEELGRLDGGQLGFRPSAGSWSALEVLEHLVRLEEVVLLRATQRPESRTLVQAVRTAGSLALLRVTLGAGVRVKVPSKAVLPEGTATFEDLAGRWDRVRRKLDAVMADQTAADLRRPFMRHPLCGWLTPAQTLAFLERHITHHTGQLRRISRSPGYPRGGEPASLAFHHRGTEGAEDTER